MKLTNKLYDEAKFVAQVVLPAVGALYFALANLWHLPASEQVVGTITAVDAFLGVLLGISTNTYKKEQEVLAAEEEAAAEENRDGDLLVSMVDGDHTLALGVKGSVDALMSKKTVTLNVVNLPLVETSSQPLPKP